MVWGQLMGQHRKGPTRRTTLKSSDGNFFLTVGMPIGHPAFIGANLSITALPATDRTTDSDDLEKVYLALRKRVRVFPDGTKTVSVYELDVWSGIGGLLVAAKTRRGVPLFLG